MITIRYNYECRCPNCDTYCKENDTIFLKSEYDYEICCDECGCVLFEIINYKGEIE